MHMTQKFLLFFFFAGLVFVINGVRPENFHKSKINIFMSYMLKITRNIMIIIILISNSNWTKWSTIQGVIGQVISNRLSAKREADLKL